MKSFFSSLWYILKIILIFMFIGIPYAIVVTAVYIFRWMMDGNISLENLDENFEAMLATQMHIGYLVSAILAFLVYRWMMKRRKRNIFEVCRFKKLSLDKVVVSIVAGMASIALSSILVGLIEFFSPSAVEQFDESMGVLEQGGTLLFLMSAGIAAPFIEEIMFRGLIFDELESKLSIKLTITIQALLFGLVHMNMVQGLYTTVSGVLMGLALIWTGSIWAPILIHLGNNVFAIMMPTAFLEQYPTFSVALFVISLLVVLPLALWYLYKNKGDYTPRTPEIKELEV